MRCDRPVPDSDILKADKSSDGLHLPQVTTLSFVLHFQNLKIFRYWMDEILRQEVHRIAVRLRCRTADICRYNCIQLERSCRYFILLPCCKLNPTIAVSQNPVPCHSWYRQYTLFSPRWCQDRLPQVLHGDVCREINEPLGAWARQIFQVSA